MSSASCVKQIRRLAALRTTASGWGNGHCKALRSPVCAYSQKPEVPSVAGRDALIASAVVASLLLLPEEATAVESLSPELADAFQSWLDTVQSLGPLAPAAFVASMAICECIPFFPTQPLSIAAGLLFGAGGGAALNLMGLCTASTIAFTLSRTAFRGVAEAVVKAETGGGDPGEGRKPNAVAQQIEKAQRMIEDGGPAQQFTAILLLRLTPIVPFSASNYVLGLTPVAYPPFIAATIVGMAVWSTLLASLGGAGRSLLTSGADFTDVIDQVSSGAGSITASVVLLGIVLGGGAVFVVNSQGLLPDPEDLGKDLREGIKESTPAAVGRGAKKPEALSSPPVDDR